MQTILSRFTWKTGAVVAVALAAVLFVAPRVHNVVKSQTACTNVPQTATFNPFPLGFNGEDCTDYPLVAARVYRDGQVVQDFAKSEQEMWNGVNAQAGDEILFAVYVHNGANQNLPQNETDATNVQMTTTVPGGQGDAHQVSVDVSANSANGGISKNGYVWVKTPANASLEVVSGSGSVYESSTLKQSGMTIGNNTISLGTIHACYQYAHFIYFKVRVTGPAPEAPKSAWMNANLGGQVQGQCLQQATVEWQTENVENVRVTVIDPNTGTESPFASEKDGYKVVDWISPGTNYTFILRGDGIDEIRQTVKGNLNCENPTTPPQKSSWMTATLGSEISGVCYFNGVIEWQTENVENVTINVINPDNGQETPFAFDEDGYQEINWLAAGKSYKFILRGTGIRNIEQIISVPARNCEPVNPPPVQPTAVVCTPKNTTTNINTPVSFTATGGDQNETWMWSIDGVLTAQGSSQISRSFATAGNHTVTVRRGNLSDNCNVTVQQPENPPVNPPQGSLVCVASATTVTSGTVVTFTAQGTTSGLVWFVNGVQAGTGTHLSRTITSSGDLVRVTNGVLQATCPTVTISTPPPTPQTLICTPATQEALPNQTVTFTASGGTGSYSWYAPNSTQVNGTGSGFSTSYTSASAGQTRPVTVTSGSQQANCHVIVKTPPVVCVPNSNVSLTNSAIVPTSGGKYSATVYYSFTGSNPMKVTYVNPNTNSEVNFVDSTTVSGSKVFDQIEANKNYTFKIYDMSSCGGLMATLVVRKDVTQCIYNANASLVAGTPVKNGSTYSVSLTWASTGSNSVRITQDGSSNVIATGAANGSTTVSNLSAGSTHTFYMYDVECGVLLTSVSVNIPQEQQPQGNQNCMYNSCNNTEINNNNNGGNNVNNNTAINGNNNTVNNINTCVNNSCNTTITYINVQGQAVPANEYRQLGVTKSVRSVNGGSFQNSVTVNSGDTVEFEIVVQNTGNQAVSNVRLQDTWNTGLNFVTNSIRIDGSYASDSFVSGNSLYLGTLSAGQQKRVTFQATVQSGQNNLSIQNIAKASGDSVSTVQDDAWVFVTGSVQGGNVNLSFSKRAYNDTKGTDATSVYASREDYITYTLTVTNSGNAPATSFVVTDDLSSVLPYADMVDNGGGSLSGNVITYPAITVPAGGTVSKSFRVRVKYHLAENLSYEMRNTYGNTVVVRINTPQVLGGFTAPKTGADTTAAGMFASLITGAAVVLKKRKAVLELIFA